MCEIPLGTCAKNEIDLFEPWNPVVHEHKLTTDPETGKTVAKPRFYQYNLPQTDRTGSTGGSAGSTGSLSNYGALPQTFENPDERCPWVGLSGDGDPLDVLEIADGPPACVGAVVPIRVLGSFALVDQGECDWKIIAARYDVDEQLAAQLSALGKPMSNGSIGAFAGAGNAFAERAGRGGLNGALSSLINRGLAGRESRSLDARIHYLVNKSATDINFRNDDAKEVVQLLEQRRKKDAALLEGKMGKIKDWFRLYKTAENKPENVLGLKGVTLDRETTFAVMQHGHNAWKLLCQQQGAVRGHEVWGGK